MEWLEWNLIALYAVDRPASVDVKSCVHSLHDIARQQTTGVRGWSFTCGCETQCDRWPSPPVGFLLEQG